MRGEPQFIYDGRLLIGEVRQRRDGQFEAVKADGKKLGRFTSANAAADELCRIISLRKSAA